MKKQSKKLFSLCLVALALTGSIQPVFAETSNTTNRETTVALQQQQGRTVTGTITDTTDGMTIIGANIMIKGSTTGVISDIDGNFSIQAKSGDVLVISYIGYKTQEIQVGNTSQLNIKLSPDTEVLDEVIIVGYGSQKKATVTGSISQIDGDEMKKANKVNLTSSLAGKTAGVIANTRSSEPGEDGASILIRGKGTLGKTDPLIVVDGVADRGFGRLNSEDIESISVLKDASAAIYGARAANGVILITTKRGKEGKVKVNYAGDFSISQPTRTPKMANSLQYATYVNEYDKRKGNQESFGPDVIDHIIKGDDPIRYPDTDWWDAATNKWTPQTQHSVSISGGTEKLSFYTSAQYLYQDVLLKDSPQDFTQYQFKSNIDAQINSSIKFSFDIMGRQEVRNRTPYDDTKNVFASLLKQSPVSAPFYPNGLLQMGDTKPDDNPIVKTQGPNGEKKYVYNLITLKPYLKIDLNKVLPGLYLDGYAALDYTFTHTKKLTHPYDIYLYNPQNGEYVNQKGSTGVINLDQNNNRSDRITLNGRVGYQHSFGKHNIDAFLAYEQSVYNYNSMDASRRNFLSTAIPELFAGSSIPEDMSNDGYSTKAARQNYFGRVTYNYQQRYLAEVAARYDGSANFASGKRWGFFPSFQLGWVISEENFFEKLRPVVNFLKLKGSFGIMGNDNIDAYQFLTQYKFTGGAIFGKDLDLNKTLNMARTANPNVTWETAKTTNVGFSAQFLDSKFGLDFDYFHSKRSDILVTRSASTPLYTGLTLPAENLGKVNNSGIELIASYRDQKGDFRWNVSANFTYAQNKVVYMDEATSVPEWQKREGNPIDGFLVYDAIGIYQTEEEIANTPHLQGAKPGDLIYRDLNGDKQINELDRFRTDETETPKIIYGFTLGGEWKGLDINVFFQGQAKAKYILKPVATNLPVEFYEGRWSESNTSEENLNAKYPRAMVKNSHGDGFNDFYSTWWMKNASFLRLKNLEIGYTLPKKWMSNVGLESCRLYLSGSNLFTIDGIDICDPESPNDTGGTNFYPLSRTFSFGVNLSF